MNVLRRQTGQSTVLTLLFLTVLIAMTGAVLDVGAWMRADRALQARTDAATLAAAQELPYSTAVATARAIEYGDKNGGGITAGDVAFQSNVVANDTIVLETERAAPGVFTRLFGVASVDVHARAVARTSFMSEARYVAPIAVNELHPQLRGCGGPCFGTATQIDLMHLHGPGSGNAAGAFGLLNLDRASGNTSPGAQTVADWLANGYSDYLPLGMYHSVPSTMFNSIQFRNAMSSRIGDEVLFPVYREPILGGGTNARYNIIGWVGFRITGFAGGGSSGHVLGHFTRVIWEGIAGQSGSELDFGARTISLID